jgi:Reverse transcriptase (RNA-dependent DNA polymerase)
LVLKGASQVNLNSVTYKSIKLKKGVRQRDPLSPYLFNLAMDFLVRWIKRLNDLNILSPIFPNCRSCLLYADDTLIFIKSEVQQIKLLKLILELFGESSALKVNLQKSELLMTSMDWNRVAQLVTIINYQTREFLMKYLGLSLSGIKRANYKNIIDGVHDRLLSLPGWQTGKLSNAGREVLVNAILSAKSVCYISLFLLPKWVIKAIDRIRRIFL